MFNFLKTRWFDIGAIIAFIIIKGILLNARLMGDIQALLWLAFAALLLFQAEEYHWPGSYPEWMNRTAHKKQLSYRAPLTIRSNFIVHVVVQWTTFLLAAVLEEDALWLGIAVMTFCFGSFIKHTFYYNIRTGSRYNPGMVTSIVCLLPVSSFFFIQLIREDKAYLSDYLIGIPLGIVFTLGTSVEVINWAKSRYFHHATA